MNMTVFLEVNRAICGGAQRTQWLRLPEKELTLNSIRFGRHVYVLGRTMQMLPLGNGRPVESASPQSLGLGVRKVLDWLSKRSRYLHVWLQ